MAGTQVCRTPYLRRRGGGDESRHSAGRRRSPGRQPIHADGLHEEGQSPLRTSARRAKRRPCRSTASLRSGSRSSSADRSLRASSGPTCRWNSSMTAPSPSGWIRATGNNPLFTAIPSAPHSGDDGEGQRYRGTKHRRLRPFFPSHGTILDTLSNDKTHAPTPPRPFRRRFRRACTLPTGSEPHPVGRSLIRL